LRVAASYKGVFNIRYQNVHGSDSNILESVKSTIDNHDVMLSHWTNENEVDYFFSTYETDGKLDELYKKKYKPKYYGYINPPSRTGHHSFQCQLLHFKNLISKIKEQEEKCGKYDMLVFTRTDAVFNIPVSEMNIDLDAVNLTIKSDDNFIVLSRKYLDVFSTIIDQLWDRGMVTHQIHQLLNEYGIPVNLITDYNPTQFSTYGHNIFSLVRLGEKSCIFDYNFLVRACESNQGEVVNILRNIREDVNGFQTQLGVVSTEGRVVTESVLEKLGVKNLFQFIVANEDYGVEKEIKNCYNHAVSVVQVNPNRCVVIGEDSNWENTVKCSSIPERNIWKVNSVNDTTLENYHSFITKNFDPWR
jgi:hypothetical protein